MIPGPFAPYAARRQQEHGYAQFSGPQRQHSGHGKQLGLAIAQPERDGLPPTRPGPLRGTLACMETLQVGYPHAVAAAGTVDDEVTIKVQPKATYQIPPRPPGRS